MKVIKEYNKEIGFIRLIACIAVLLYHMGILKGGYLSVCIFFCLSGYLTCMSCFKKEKVSLGKYYLNRLLQIYLPLLIVVLISIAVISLMPSINWFNLKPETTSVLLGYNNFWQLNANLDYFARHIDSPFMHLWYIAIILQFDLVFPMIFKILKWSSKKICKAFPCIILAVISLFTLGYFYYSSINNNIMVTYYNTFTRIFSLIIGVLVGFIHYNYKPLVFKKISSNIIGKIIFCTYLISLILLNVFIAADSKYYAISMIVTTLITCRLIDYSISINKEKDLSIFDKIIKSLSNISYEIYLVQYPIIFILQEINITYGLKILLIVSSVLLISYFIKFSLNYKLKKLNVIRYIAFLLVLIISIYGGYQYVIAKDHTEEMKQLELQLAENEKIMKEQQKEYAESLKQKQEEWANTLEDLENYEKELPTYVSNLPIVGVGDSVMLGTLDVMRTKFPKGYFDAQTSRTAWVANGILQSLLAVGLLGDPVLINLGANGDCDSACKNTIVNTIGNRKLFWINVTNYHSVNNSLNALASRYSNVHIIDWYTISRGHPEYFIADGIHLTALGTQVYVNMIYEAIYNVYLDEYNKKKESILNSYENEKSKTITFFGNELLLNAYSDLKNEFSNNEFVMDDEMNYEKLKDKIMTMKENGVLSSKLVLTFDQTANLTENEYQNLIELCDKSKIYIVSTNTKMNFDKYPNVKVIDFYPTIKENNDYLMPDKLHLTDLGNKMLKTMILEEVKVD